MSLVQIVILAVIQGLAELLPVSSSAHVIAAAKLMRIDPSTPAFGLLLVMLHTGTMFAVIVYFWNAWKRAFFSSSARAAEFLRLIIIATIVTGFIGYGLKLGIEHYIKHSHPGIAKGEIEELFKNTLLLAAALAAAGLLILYSGLRATRPVKGDSAPLGRDEITSSDAVVVGAVQGLALPFRGFSRSGSTISAGLLRGIARVRLEEYSFALAVVLTPAVVLYESLRLIHHQQAVGGGSTGVSGFVPGLLGMTFSFIAGLIALRVLSRLLENGKWWVFGIYCLVASCGLLVMYHAGL